ncbi:MAG TPA: hypothetical protein P5119_08735 [Candidatus Aminicenantes bacterium]|nr:hypothetical protein [Candidatus Aminicenantes bacterium]HRY65411.1 hypothetical protein [Candidatus Aminicenantes bacterium]HRZ72121.1 hypothetical protein [Candidatus Aminicenantes bacterium]
MIRKLTPFIALSLLLAAAPLTAGDIRFELGFGWTLVGPTMSSTYVNSYKPPFTPADRYIDSAAAQTLRFKPKTTYGMNGYFNVLFGGNFGLQLLADYHRPHMGGSNSPYDVSLQFTAFEPETYTFTVDGPSPDGNLTETTFSLNALARFRLTDTLSLSVSAGPSVFHFEGKAGYIDYTYADLALVGEEYQLSAGTFHMVASFGPDTRYGMNVGVEAAYEAFRHVILAFDLRYYAAAKSDLQLAIMEDETITVPLDEIEAAIGLGTLRVDPSYFRAGLAIRFVF